MRLVLAILAVAGTAHADAHVVQRGETLAHVAEAHGCSIDAVMRANGLRTTLVKPGTAIDIPSCSLRARAQTRTVTKQAPRRRVTSASAEADKARAALEMIDGATWIAERPAPKPATSVASTSIDVLAEAAGAPWRGKLRGGEQLHAGDGYRVRRPSRSFGASHVIDHLRSSIAVVRALYPHVHTLAIGDISAEHGGKIAEHRSHQSGLDVDVGFYFTHVPDGYPDSFVAANDQLDLEATWALLTAFARTTSVDDGVDVIFLDYAVQRRLYDWAHARGTPDEDLQQLFQYPRGKDTMVGLARHWPNHADHLHVRFRSRR